MPSNTIPLDMVRRFAGADPETDATVLELCTAAAVDWYNRAGVPPTTAGELYVFWVANLAAYFFDHRGAGGSDEHVPAYIVESVHQLRDPVRR